MWLGSATSVSSSIVTQGIVFVQYCEYAPEPAKCYEWMKANLPDHYSRIEESSTYI